MSIANVKRIDGESPPEIFCGLRRRIHSSLNKSALVCLLPQTSFRLHTIGTTSSGRTLKPFGNRPNQAPPRLRHHRGPYGERLPLVVYSQLEPPIREDGRLVECCVTSSNVRLRETLAHRVSRAELDRTPTRARKEKRKKAFLNLSDAPRYAVCGPRGRGPGPLVWNAARIFDRNGAPCHRRAGTLKLSSTRLGV